MPRKQKTYHFIYKTTNKLTGSYYYGMHSTNDLNDGYLGSGKRLKYSINKYGEENHIREIIEFCDDQKSLKIKESEIVNESTLSDPLCMNLTLGGNGDWYHCNSNSDLQRAKCIRGNIKQKWLRENDKEWKAKTSKNRSNSLLLSYKEGRRKIKTPDWTDKKHKNETKKKISEANKKSQLGKRNSQFGTCWIYNEILNENKKIQKVDIEKWLFNGWVKGRKQKTKSGSDQGIRHLCVGYMDW